MLCIFIIMFLVVLICIVLQDFYIVFLKDHPTNEESAFQRHISVLSSLNGRLVKLVRVIQEYNAVLVRNFLDL